MNSDKKLIENLVVDTAAFIKNAPLQDIAKNLITCPEVVNEITNKRQLRRLVVLPYDLVVKDPFPENVKIVTDFSKKTGDYPSLSATDIKIMALTYQLEMEKVGIDHIRTEPIMQRSVVTTPVSSDGTQLAGFFFPGKPSINLETSNLTDDDKDGDNVEVDAEEADSCNLTDDDKGSDCIQKQLVENLAKIQCEEDKAADLILVPVDANEEESDSLSDDEDVLSDHEDDDVGWITPSNVKSAKKVSNSELKEEKHVTVACMTTDFAMQNVLKQMNLNVSALDGRMIKQLRTYVLRCYTCFKTTSIMTKKFCPKCGNDTLKKVAVSLDENGKLQIHINSRRPLTARGKKYSLPRFKGGKHSNNPIIVADQPLPDNKPTRLAKTKTDALHEDYTAGYSAFAMRDVNSKSAQMGIRSSSDFKYWMKKNPNESRRRRK